MTGNKRETTRSAVDSPDTARPWIVLGLLGTLLLASVLFVHVPVVLWAGNVAEFSSGIGAILAVGVSTVIASLVVAAITLWLVPRPARAALASLVCAAGLFGWFYANFLVGRMTVLDGQGAPSDFRTPLGIWEVPLVALVGLLLAWGITKTARPATLAFLLLNIGLGVTTVVAIKRPREAPVPRAAPLETSQIFQFSSRSNVLVVLLDGLQSDIVDDILTRDPALRATFDGFELYKDALGVAPTTFLSIPVIHSGDVHRGPASLGDYFVHAIEHDSFLNHFVAAGYDGTLIDPIAGVCPSRVASCVSTTNLLDSWMTRLTNDSLRLLDLSLLRVAPFWLRSHIYNDGRWFAARLTHLSYELNRIFETRDLLQTFRQRLTVDDVSPTIKFLHLFATHVPYVLGDRCRLVAWDSSMERATSQAQCALRWLGELLARMDQAGVYDNTVIMVLADHGVMRTNHYASEEDQGTVEWSRLAGAANPAFLLKKLQARGEVRDAPGVVYLTDVGATLCAASGACTAPNGIVAGQAATGRLRTFYHYVWQHSYWTTREIPDIVAYEVGAPLWRVDSWRRSEPAAPYRPGDYIAMSDAEASDRYLRFGWGGAYGNHRWTAEPFAEMVLHIDEEIGEGLELAAHLFAFVPPPLAEQQLTWRANGQELGTWTFAAGSGISERRLWIPRSALNGNELRLSLYISAATSPKEVGMSEDPRRLGFAFQDLRLVRSAGSATPE